MIAHSVHIEQDTAIVFGLAMAILALVGLLAYVVDDLIRSKADLTEEVEVSHDDCVARMIDAVSDRVLAQHLRVLADSYGTPDEVYAINKIKREVWKPEGPVLPVLWLHYHADLLDPPTPERPSRPGPNDYEEVPTS